jgi:hypothetical protein
MVGEFGDSEDIVSVLGEEGVLKVATQGFDGSADGFQGVAEIPHSSVPSGTGEADLVEKTAHDQLFPGEECKTGSVSVRG